MVSFLQVSPPKPCGHLSLPQYVPHFKYNSYIYSEIFCSHVQCPFKYKNNSKHYWFLYFLQISVINRVVNKNWFQESFEDNCNTPFCWPHNFNKAVFFFSIGYHEQISRTQEATGNFKTPKPPHDLHRNWRYPRINLPASFRGNLLPSIFSITTLTTLAEAALEVQPCEAWHHVIS